MSVRRPVRPEPSGADAAARRLALIAADLGVGPTGSRGPAAGPDLPDQPVAPWWADHTRVAGPEPPVPPVPPVLPVSPAGPPALPHPGRHAARRRRPRPDPRRPLAVVADRLPVLGLSQIAVVAVAVAVGLAVTTWWVVRDQPQSLEPVAAQPAAPLVPTGAGAGASTGGAGTTPTTPTTPTNPTGSATSSVTVDVAGKVRRPGIVVLPTGARVTDALRAAGGARKGVDLVTLNLARVLVDGEQIVVGAPGSQTVSPPPAPGAASGGRGPLVNLNTATLTELETLPQVGPVTAQSILAWREAHGGFTSVDELLEVDGIGEKTLEQITPHVTV